MQLINLHLNELKMHPLFIRLLSPGAKVLARLCAPYLPSSKPISLAADFVFAEAVPGDYLEFGTFKGASFVEAYRLLEKAYVRWNDPATNSNAFSSPPSDNVPIIKKRSIRYFAFDSFKGLPPLSDSDKGHSRFSTGRYDCSQESFIKQIQYSGVDLKKIVINPGFYNESLTKDFKVKNSLNAASIIMIDCDLYESTVPVLEFVTDLLQQGSILIFDDWFAFRGDPSKGQQRAVSEWLSRNPDIMIRDYAYFGPSQRAFIVHKAY